jgi:sphinganine-1-phosphate aldolase
VTAHAAFDKAGKYFGVKVIHIGLNEKMEVDVAAVERAITSNTIMVCVNST